MIGTDSGVESFEQDTDEWNAADMLGNRPDLEAGSVAVTGYTDGSILIEVAGTAEEVSALNDTHHSHSKITEPIGELLQDLDVKEPARIVLDLSNVESPGVALTEALNSKFFRAAKPGAPGERGSEVVLVSPTDAVAKVLNGQHSFIKESGRIHVFENRESAVAGLTEDGDRTAALAEQHADIVQQALKKAAAGNQAKETVKEIESTLQCEEITPGSKSVILAVVSAGHFTGNSEGQPYRDVIAGVATDSDVILDATAATFLTDGGVSELLGVAKKTAPQTVHLVVEEGSSVEQSIRNKQLHKLPGINLVNSRDEALVNYLG